jgi:uncharacterized protein (DUF1015 family)
MIDFRPFRALHYDPQKVALGDVIAPPYDVIDDDELERLYARSPENVVRLILNRSADRYAASASALADWRARGILAVDREAALYLYAQDFTAPSGAALQRMGFMAAMRLQSFSEGGIRPHERTFSRAKEDRLRLVNACRANLSPIFGIYADRAAVLAPARQRAEREAPWLDVRDERGNRHRVWRIADAASVEHIRSGLRDATVLIADGHHRYETALAYRDQRRAAGDTDSDAPHNFVLMYLDSMDDPGLVVRPTHRVWNTTMSGLWRAVESSFEVRDVGKGSAAFAALEAEKAPGCLAVAERDGVRLLRLRDPRVLEEAFADVHPAVRGLDVTVLDAFLLRRLLGIDVTRSAQEGALTYTHDDAQALAAAAQGQTAFLLRTPRMSEVEAVCLSGQTMPEKSTYFYPKLESGLVFHLLDEPAGKGANA